ncbi:hypothetical protein F2Q69_00023250 [Brassica cretica]|uniref:Uncharacterized protein n=1 Tax=Brassica cretica TaxID=69181 RepID=A0A8S9Q8J1_BRACR|nr:hypothetical protein F2Q69_00023250 [Brassica cretica]
MLVAIGIGGGETRLRLCVSSFPLSLLTLFIVQLWYVTIERKRDLKHMARLAFSFSVFQSCGQKDLCLYYLMFETCLTLLLAFFLLLFSGFSKDTKKRRALRSMTASHLFLLGQTGLLDLGR